MTHPLIQPPPAEPELAAADIVLINHSGGKDSMAMTDVVIDAATRAGVRDRVVILHNPLGLVEWPGTPELVAEHAAHYGVRYEQRWRAHGDLLQQIRQRRMWPSARARYCTSDHKRGPGRRLITELVAELGLPKGHRAQVVTCLGVRAQESAGRARLAPLAANPAASSGVRAVTTWHPILSWRTEQVWDRVRATGLRYHPAYDHGMSRLSCSLCVLASRADLIRAIQLRPALADEYVRLEWEIGHCFRPDTSMLELVAQARGHEVDAHRLQVLRLRAEYQRAARDRARLPSQRGSVGAWIARDTELEQRLTKIRRALRALGYATDPAATPPDVTV